MMAEIEESYDVQYKSVIELISHEIEQQPGLDRIQQLNLAQE